MIYKKGDIVTVAPGATSTASRYVGKLVRIDQVVRISGRDDVAYWATPVDEIVPRFALMADEILDQLTSAEELEIAQLFNDIKNIPTHDQRPTPAGYTTVVDPRWMSRHARSQYRVRQNEMRYFSYPAYANQELGSYYFSSGTLEETTRRLDGSRWTYRYLESAQRYRYSNQYSNQAAIESVRLAHTRRDSQLRSN